MTWCQFRACSTHGVPKPLLLEAKGLLLWEMDSLKHQDMGCDVLALCCCTKQTVSDELFCAVVLITFWKVTLKRKHLLFIIYLALPSTSLCVNALQAPLYLWGLPALHAHLCRFS